MKCSKDGRIRLGFHFELLDGEPDEIKEYVWFIAGQEASAKKTMLRLTYRSGNRETAAQNRHVWPENVKVCLNETHLQTRMV